MNSKFRGTGILKALAFSGIAAAALLFFLPRIGFYAGGTPRPLCDNPAVIDNILSSVNKHPDIAPLMPAKGLRLIEVWETGSSEHPEIGKETFNRVCVGKIIFANGEKQQIGWNIFTTDTIFGPIWAPNFCIDKYFLHGFPNCDCYKEGKIAG